VTRLRLFLLWLAGICMKHAQSAPLVEQLKRVRISFLLRLVCQSLLCSHIMRSAEQFKPAVVGSKCDLELERPCCLPRPPAGPAQAQQEKAALHYKH